MSLPEGFARLRFPQPARARARAAPPRQPALLHYLLALFSYSCFLSETLIQQPDLILWLGRDKHLARLKSKEDLTEEFARLETGALDADPALTLVRFKRREYLRITLKDILGMAELGETTLELSLLADVLLEKALERAQRELQARYGAPQTHDARGRPVAARFAVVSLGKLGGQDDLAISLPTALDYYRRQAREWELQMLLKARHSAGDAGLVRDFLRGVEPFLYRGEMHFAAVESVLNAREQFARKREAGGADRLNVKLAPGGIRDIEFLVQCLQRLYGRDDPWVRAPGTLVAAVEPLQA